MAAHDETKFMRYVDVDAIAGSASDALLSGMMRIIPVGGIHCDQRMAASAIPCRTKLQGHPSLLCAHGNVVGEVRERPLMILFGPD